MSALSRMLGKLLNREEPRKEVEEIKPMEWLDDVKAKKSSDWGPQDMVQVEPEETLKSRKAISPVIATVILVAVTITVAVAVAYWMSGIAGQYTSFEKIEIQSGYAVKYETTGAVPIIPDDAWKIIITLKNSGTSTATLINCFINDQIIGASSTGELSTVYADGTLLPSGTAGEAGGIGESSDVGITIDSGDSVEVTIINFLFTYSSSGTTINVKLHSAGGMDYIRLITLP